MNDRPIAARAHQSEAERLLALYGATTKAGITAELKTRVAAKLVDKSGGPVQWGRDPASKAYLHLTYQQPELVRRALLLFNLREVIRQRFFVGAAIDQPG